MNLLVQYLPYLIITFLVLAIVFVALAILQFIVEIIQDISYRLGNVVFNIIRIFRKN